jgi:hypothetical protein
MTLQASGVIKLSNITTEFGNWSVGTCPGQSYTGVAYGNGTFVGVAFGTDPGTKTTNVITSTDGITWTLRAMPSAQHWRAVTFGNGYFCAVVDGLAIAATSADGINWTQRTLINNDSWRSLTYGNGRFVIMGPTKLNISTDNGATWSSTSWPINAQWTTCLAFGNGYFVAVAYNSNIAATSTDGVTWTQRTLPKISFWSSIAYGNGTFVVSGPNNSGVTGSEFLYSTDNGVTWTAGEMPTTQAYMSMTYGNGYFCAVASNGSGIASTALSSDGINWISNPNNGYAYWQTCGYGNGKFVSLQGGQGNGTFTKTVYMDASRLVSLSKYYKGGGIVDTSVTGIPTSGTINLSNFYSKTKPSTSLLS